MTGMIPEDHFAVGAIAQFFGVSERQVREVIECGEMAAVGVGQRAWEFEDFWASPDPPADGVLSDEVPDGANALSDVSDIGVSWAS